MKFYAWSNDKYDQRLSRLIDSAKSFEISVEVIGHGRNLNEGGLFKGKNDWLYERLCELDDDEIVVCTDAYDVIYLSSPSEIEEKFLKMKTPILYGAGYFLVCCNSNDRKYMDKLANGAFYKYLNSGVVIGYAKNLKLMFEEIELYKPPSRPHVTYDQGFITKYYINNSNSMKLDYDTEIIWNDMFNYEQWPNKARGRRWNNLVNKLIDEMENEYFDENFIDGRLRNKNTKNFPCILHIPGDKYMTRFTDYLVEKLKNEM
jgi:hypothetical protein